MKRRWRYLFMTISLVLGFWVPAGLAGEPQEKPVIEQILDLLLQRGQISQEEYRTLQEKAQQEKAPAVLAGIDRGKPFLRSADDTIRMTFGGRVQADFHLPLHRFR